MLLALRDEACEKVRVLRQDREQESELFVGDEIDAARSGHDDATRRVLTERAEQRLRQLDEALAHLEEGEYGICKECSNPIPLERLMAVPFASHCVGCEQELGSASLSNRAAGRKGVTARQAR